ncbi:MAG: murein biosynthesis integral membrane protein MurJ [Holosporaceae bacterium]|jgi:putative peptidoglycan lipid II flippase|nr:murein biosynthesis integral membrane protein MurJ [Holosporaceae bacterium]
MGIIKAAFTVGAFILLSRIVGFLRECVMVFTLEVGMYTDALLVALRLSNTFRRIFAEGAFNASFLPRFSKILHVDGEKKSLGNGLHNRSGATAEAMDNSSESGSLLSPHKVLVDVFSALVWTTTIFCLGVLIFFPAVVRIFVSGFDVLGEKFRLTVLLGRISFPYLIFISLASLFGGVLNCLNKFALPSATQSIMSLCTMAALLVGYFYELPSLVTVKLVTVFVLLSGILQSYILYISLRKYGFRVSLKLRCWSEPVRDIMKNMIPGIIAVGVWQLNVLVDTTVASFLPTGTITYISLADRLNQFPLGTLGVALSTALLPTLSQYIGKKDYDHANKELERGIFFALFLTFLATVILVALDKSTVAVAFQRGLFQQEQVKITADALVGFAVGLPAFVLTKIFSSLYFATGNTKTPVIFGTCSVAVNIISLIILVPFKKHFGLALCTSISAFVNATLLMGFVPKNIHLKLSKAFWAKISSQLCAAAVAYGGAVYLANTFWSGELGNKSLKWLIYSGFICAVSIIFFTTTVVCLKLFGQSEWKLWKKHAW